MVYNDIDTRKKAFIFELDNVLYPEKDFLFQVYYLYGSFLDYTAQIDAKAAVELMITTYWKKGKEAVFPALLNQFGLDAKYEQNFSHLMINAQLPLKLLLYPQMLALLQEIVIDRKQLFIATNGNPQQQLNKIKYTDWGGLEKYLICYFAEEFVPKPEPDIIHTIINNHNLERRDLLMISNTETDVLCAEASGIDYIEVVNFLI